MTAPRRGEKRKNRGEKGVIGDFFIAQRTKKDGFINAYLQALANNTLGKASAAED